MKISDYVNLLPDSFKKNPESNNYKLLSLEERLVRDLRSDIEAVDATADIYTATGKTLDLYGQMYGKPRGTSTDEQYRYLILQSVAQTQVTGDYNSIVNAIAVAFGVPATEFRLVETGACEVEISNLPFTILQNAGMTAEQMQDIIQGLLPVGVKLAPMNLEGTFEFGSADDYDESKGFGNVAQTMGGYLGHLAG